MEGFKLKTIEMPIEKSITEEELFSFCKFLLKSGYTVYLNSDEKIIGFQIPDEYIVFGGNV